MKRALYIFLALALAAAMLCGGAAESNWQFISPITGQSFDDVQIGTPVKISGYGTVTLLGAAIEDRLGYYHAGSNAVGTSQDYYRSGNDSRFLIVKADIENTGAIATNYLGKYEVRVYDGTNTYGGWAYQLNYANAVASGIDYGADSGLQNMNWVINTLDNFAVEPGTLGHYVFGCTLPANVAGNPNAVKLTVTLDGNTLNCYPLKQPAAQPTPAPTAFAPVNVVAEPQYVYASGGDSHVRTGPGLAYASIGTIRKGGGATYLGKSSVDDRGVTWYNVDYKGDSAWVSSKYTTLKNGTWTGGYGVSPTKAPKASYVIGKTGKSNVRTGPGLSYKEVGVLHKEETATYLGEQSTDERGVVWYKIRWKGEERWVSSKYTELHE